MNLLQLLMLARKGHQKRVRSYGATVSATSRTAVTTTEVRAAVPAVGRAEDGDTR